MIVRAYDSALMDGLVSILLQRDVVAAGIHLDLNRRGLLQWSSVDHHLSAFGLTLDVDERHSVCRRPSAKHLSAAHNADVVRPACDHQTWGITDCLPGGKLQISAGF